MPRLRLLVYLILAHLTALPTMAAEPKLEKELAFEAGRGSHSWLSFDSSGQHLAVIVPNSEDQFSRLLVWNTNNAKREKETDLHIPSPYGPLGGIQASFLPSGSLLCVVEKSRKNNDISLQGISLKTDERSLQWKEVDELVEDPLRPKARKVIQINQDTICQISLVPSLTSLPILYVDLTPIGKRQFVEAKHIPLQGIPSILRVNSSLTKIVFIPIKTDKGAALKEHNDVIQMIDMNSKELTTLASKMPFGRLAVIEFSPSGRRVISGGHDGYLRQWKVDGLEEEFYTSISNFTLRTLAYSKDEKYIACTTTDSKENNLYMIDANSSKTVFSKKIPSIRNATFSPDSNKLAVLYEKGIQIYDLTKWSKSLK